MGKLHKREKFGSRFGVLMAMAGSAIGLGNMWRFPYLAAKNGGAAFIIIYLVLMLTISLPTMITEYLIGRRSRANAYTAFDRLGYPKLKFIGILAILASIFVLSFYCVVGGWATRYLVQACALKFQSLSTDYAGQFATFVSSPISPLLYTLIFLGITAAVISAGVKKGIEYFSKIMMTVLFVIIILVAIRSVTLPGAIEGIKYLLVPDFSKVSGETWVTALGQSFFSLGLGCGTILIYGSYVKKEEDLCMSAIFTAVIDTVFAIIAGIAIIPAIFAIAQMNGFTPNVDAGPGLVFITLPGIFAAMPFGQVIAILFFVSLLLAAVTSSISLLESSVAFIIEEWKMKRRKAVLLAFIACLVLGTFCSLSQGVLSNIRIFGLNVFDFFDKTSSNFFMTISCLLMIIFTGWFLKKEVVLDELSGRGYSNTPRWLIRLTYFLIRYIAPLGVLTIIICNFFL